MHAAAFIARKTEAALQCGA